ncbi:uncharacterized protein LOC141719533 [Apium graveolens]|uniref:uncharacterized protein LOC141719533 n=1 Tax=Apium graveolens TaxID=4045 RepID=UPI003D7B58CA
MANLAKLEFVALDVSGNNYLSWVLDAELHLSANGLKDTIDPEKIPTVEQNAKAIIFLRERNFQKYGEPISLLLVAEKNNELLLKNHRIRPTGSAQLPGVHNTSFLKNERGKGNRGGRGYGRNRGRGNFHGRFHNQYHSGHLKWQRDGYNSGHHKWQRKVPNKRKTPQEGENRGICHWCGSEGHWQRTCRTPKHLVDLYESSKRNNGKRVATNFANYNLVNEPVNKASNEIDTDANLYYGLDD